jgi:hypothetical protein
MSDSAITRLSRTGGWKSWHLGDPSSTPTREAPCNLPNWPLENGEGRCSTLGLPIGLQIAGAPFAESTVLALAHCI